MGRHHCTALTRAKGAELAMVCDTDPERLKAVTTEFAVKGTKKYTDILANPDIDVVCICTESGTHADLAIAATLAGKHILVEKPVDIAIARVVALHAAVKKAGVTCACIFQTRFHPLNTALKKNIDKGMFGKPLAIHGWLPWNRPQTYYEGKHGKWKGTWRLDGGGSLMNQGIHTLDLMQWFGGRVDEVCGFFGVYGHKIEAEDQAAAVLKFANGAMGTIYTATCVVPNGTQRIDFFGDQGSFAKVGDKLASVEAAKPAATKKLLTDFGGVGKDTASKDAMALATDGHVAQIEDLVRSIRKGTQPAIPIEDAAHSVAVANAIYEAARKGRVVKVSTALR